MVGKAEQLKRGREMAPENGHFPRPQRLNINDWTPRQNCAWRTEKGLPTDRPTPGGFFVAGRDHFRSFPLDPDADTPRKQPLAKMPPTTTQEKTDVSKQLLGNDGNFTAYFKFLDDLVQRDSDYSLTIESPSANAPISTDSVLLAASVVKSNTSTTKRDMENRFREVAASNPTLRYNDKAIKMAIQAMFMVDPAAKEWHSADFTRGDYRPSSWLPEETLLDFIQRLFPPSLQSSQQAARMAVESRALKARKLQKRLGARFQLTNNLAEHLLFDERRNCLYIFHQVAFLKAHLGQYEAKSAVLGIDLKQSLEGWVGLVVLLGFSVPELTTWQRHHAATTSG